MAKQTVALEITTDSSQAESSVKGLKQQLREAQKEVAAMADKFGLTSQQAQEAAKKAADLKDRIGDAKSLTDAFNPDAKFKAFAGALQGVAGGFSFVTGAMGTLGVKSDEVEKMLLKVNSAMAMVQGLNALGESVDAFKILGASIKDTKIFQDSYNAATKTTAIVQKAFGIAVDETSTSFKALRGAIIATGIGALIVAIGMLIANFDDIKKALSGVSDAQQAYNDTLEDYKKGAAEATQKVTDVKVAFDLAKQGVISKDEALQKYNDTLGDAFGKATDLNEAEEIYAKKADIYIKVTALKAQANAIFAKAAEEKAKGLTVTQEDQTTAWDKFMLGVRGGLGMTTSALTNYANAQDENAKKEKTTLEKRSNSYTQLGEDLLKQAETLSKQNGINNDYEIKQNQDAVKENERIQKEKIRIAEEAAKQIADANKQLNSEIAKNNEEAYLNSVKDERKRNEEKIIIDFENERTRINNSKASAEVKAAAIKSADEKAYNELLALRDKYLEEDKKKDEDAKKEQLKRNQDASDQSQTLADENYLRTITNDEQRAKEKERIDYEKKVAEINAMQIGEFEKNSLLQQAAQAHQNTLTDIEKKGHEDRLKAEEVAYQSKVQLWQLTGDALNQLSEIVGKQTAEGKSLALAQVLIDTAVAISALTKNSEANPANAPTAGIAGAIQFATGIVRILANIAKAKQILSQAKTPGGGGGGGNLPTNAPTKMPSAPVAPMMSQTALNQQMINQVGNAAVRAFVVESDVSGNQERIRRLNRAARIN